MASDDSVRILAIGDICLRNARERGLLDSELQELFSEYDMITCDLGITLDSSNAEKAMKVGPHEQQMADSVKICQDIGISMVRLAGNHITDYGLWGMEHLKRELERNEVSYIGVSDKKGNGAYDPRIYTIRGMKIACFSAGEIGFGCLEQNDYGYAWINSYQLQRAIVEIRDVVDYTIVFVHAGLECVPIPLKEWRERYYTLIDLGADFVIATHPHIVQGIEEHGKGLIAYSLGNFAYDFEEPEDRESWDCSIMLSLQLKKNKRYVYEMIPVKYENQMVKSNREDMVFRKHFEYAMKVLQDGEYYQNEIKRECWEYFERYFFDYYINNAVKLNGVIDYAFLWHNVAIESLAFMTRSALHELMYANEGRKGIEVVDENPFLKKYVMWGYGKIGKIAEEYCKKKEIEVVGIVDENCSGEMFISKEHLLKQLECDKNLMVIITTDNYYLQIRDFLFQNLKRRQFMDFHHFIAWVQEYELKIRIQGA